MKSKNIVVTGGPIITYAQKKMQEEYKESCIVYERALARFHERSRNFSADAEGHLALVRRLEKRGEGDRARTLRPPQRPVRPEAPKRPVLVHGLKLSFCEVENRWVSPDGRFVVESTNIAVTSFNQHTHVFDGVCRQDLRHATPNSPIYVDLVGSELVDKATARGAPEFWTPQCHLKESKKKTQSSVDNKGTRRVLV